MEVISVQCKHSLCNELSKEKIWIWYNRKVRSCQPKVLTLGGLCVYSLHFMAEFSVIQAFVRIVIAVTRLFKNIMYALSIIKLL